MGSLGYNSKESGHLPSKYASLVREGTPAGFSLVETLTQGLVTPQG